MQSVIKQLYNLFKNKKIFPITKTSAVYDNDGNRLDNEIEEIKNNLGKFVIVGIVTVSESAETSLSSGGTKIATLEIPQVEDADTYIIVDKSAGYFNVDVTSIINRVIRFMLINVSNATHSNKATFTVLALKTIS